MDPAEKADQKRVSAMLPLALLEALRDHDLPSEVLEDENFRESLPRRLGLSDVVFLQIRRFEESVRRGQTVPLSEASDLMRLVLRRPDAATVLREAGSAIAQRQFRRGRRPAALTIRGHGLPAPLVLAAARRSVHRLLVRLLGRDQVEPVERPLTARLQNPFATEVEDGTACVLFASVIEEMVRLYTRTQRAVVHTRCVVRGDDACEWSLVE